MAAQDVADQLPDIATVRARARSLAMLDAILSPRWEHRYYSFNAQWGPQEALASMRNGSGDEYAIVFAPAGAWIRVFAHESPMSPWAVQPPRLWPGVADAVPAVFAAYLREPAFLADGILQATACLWRQPADAHWHAGPIRFPTGHEDPDGSHRLLSLLIDGSAEGYQQFAGDYYQTDPEPAAIRQVLALRPLTQELVTRINHEVRLSDLATDLAEIAYPVA
jgi:hypothetical protein